MMLGNFVPRIKFLTDWNRKLACDYFHTIRPHAPDKKHNYESKVGEKFEVIVKGQVVEHARLISTNATLRLRDIPYEFLVADTGSEKPYEVFEQFGIRKDDLIILLLFRKLAAEGSQQQAQQQGSQAARN